MPFSFQTRQTYYAFPACLTSPFYYCNWPVGLVARFSLRVREVPGAHDYIQAFVSLLTYLKVLERLRRCLLIQLPFFRLF